MRKPIKDKCLTLYINQIDSEILLGLFIGIKLCCCNDIEQLYVIKLSKTYFAIRYFKKILLIKNRTKIFPFNLTLSFSTSIRVVVIEKRIIRLIINLATKETCRNILKF